MKQSIVGLKLLRHLAASGFKIFTVQQAEKATRELDLNPNYTTQTLHHLVKEHWVTRVKKGVYAFSAESGFGNCFASIIFAGQRQLSLPVSGNHFCQLTPHKIVA